MGSFTNMPSPSQDVRLPAPSRRSSHRLSFQARLWQQSAAFVLRRRRIILPVLVLMLAAVEGIKLLRFGPHSNPTVLLLDLIILGMITLLVGLLIAALERSEAVRIHAEEQVAASTAERKLVAQNLHDTLAQNISYLRLRLDQLTVDGDALPQQPVEIAAGDLAHMRAAAEEAYCQVRMTLDELNPLPVQDLTAAIDRQTAVIAQRAGLRLRITQIGSPYTLPAPTNQQILYIVREAVHNVEKHACAQSVHVQVVWLEKELIIKITDDGVGMLPNTVHDESHYGLWIMRHRASEIGGAVTVQPASGPGTEVTLWLPRPQGKPVVGSSSIARSAGCES